jgi:hypothetical protein
MHPIFMKTNSERRLDIATNTPLSICLHEAGHFHVACGVGLRFSVLHLPHFDRDNGGQEPDHTSGANLPAVTINKRGLSPEAMISVLLGGYVGELCLYDRSYIDGGGDYSTCVMEAANDARDLVRIQPLLGPTLPETRQEIEKLLVSSLKYVNLKPYLLLARDIKGFRESVSNLYARWKAIDFHALTGGAELFLPLSIAQPVLKA